MPNIHPLFVHFPIALLTVSSLFDGIGLATKREEFLRVGWWTMIAGVIALAGTVITGLLAEDTVVISEAAANSFALHEQLAFLSSTLYGALFFWRIASRTALPLGRERIFVMLSIGGMILIWITGWYGGDLVYGYGVGVQMPVSPH